MLNNSNKMNQDGISRENKRTKTPCDMCARGKTMKNHTIDFKRKKPNAPTLPKIVSEGNDFLFNGLPSVTRGRGDGGGGSVT